MPAFLPYPFTAPTGKWTSAAIAAVFAVALRGLLSPALGDELPFVIAAPVTLFCALMWGAGPGALATVICLVGSLLPGIPPDSLGVDHLIKCLAYAMIMAATCWLVARVEAMRSESAPMAEDTATPLVRWLTAALLGAVLVPATALVGVGWWSYHDAVQASRETMVRRTDLVHEHALRVFAVVKRLATEAGALTNDADERIRARESDARQRLSDMLLSVPSVVNLNVWNAQAVPLVRSDRAVDPAVTVVDRDYFLRQAAQDVGVDLSEVLVGRQTGKELFNLTIRRPSANGVFNGIVAVSMSPDYFRDYYRAIVAQNPEVESISLFRTDGRYLAHWPSIPGGATSLSATAPLSMAIQRGEHAGLVYGPEGGADAQRIEGFRRLEGVPAYVVVRFSEAAMMATWVRTMGIVTAIALPISLMLVAVTVLARRRVLSEQRAQRQLREQIRLLAATEKNALEAHRRETLAALTAGVAHDFNNLLAIVSNSLHVQNVRHPEIASEAQNAAMRRAVENGTRLTRQLLSFTRKQALRPEVINLQTWLPELRDLLTTTLGSRIPLEITVASNVPPILVDAAELELALVNLAVNSKHAQPNGGSFGVTVDLHADAHRRQVALCATDTGKGIAPEILNRVTEPFFTTKAPGAGSGLGLNQVRQFVEAAGGVLRIDSVLDRGTTVRLVFPALDVGTADDELVAPSPVVPLDLFKGHVLVVEDNDEVATVTTQLITSMGLRVTRAASAAEALELLRSREPADKVDFLLTDIVMPGEMDGVALARRVRQEWPHLPVTVITGYSDNVQSALQSGLDVLQKPLALDELLARLRAAFPST